MKYLIILLLLINISIALKRKRRTRGSGEILVNSVTIAAHSKDNAVIEEPTLLSFEYDESTITIKNFYSKANFEQHPNPIINVSKALEKKDLILYTDLCANNFDTCFMLISPFELHLYSFTFCDKANDTLKQIRSVIFNKRQKMAHIVGGEKFDDEEILDFKRMSNLFYSLEIYDKGFKDLREQYGFVMANKFPIDKAFFKSDELIQIDKGMKKYFNDHAEEIIKIIETDPCEIDIVKVKNAILDKWNNEWINTHGQSNMKYENHEDCALYAWVLVHHFIKKPKKEEYYFILDTIMMGHKARLVDDKMSLIPNVNFRGKKIKSMGYDDGLKQLARMDLFTKSYKANLIKLISLQVERLKKVAGIIVRVKIRDILL
jgi:hypothetical protein